jgi:hypothetical protein
MPLLDHFHPPISLDWPWESFHSDWASSIARGLNRGVLPRHFLALPRVYFGGRVEIDVATIERGGAAHAPEGGGVATAVWAPPRPVIETAVEFADLPVFEIEVYEQETGRRLVAAVELVSLANKYRPEHRDAFVIKCAGYLQQGVSVVVVDAVTARSANLHRQLLELLNISAHANGSEFPDLYAAAYRTFTVKKKGKVQVWEEPLVLGKPLPTLPLWISPELAIPLDLDSSYRETCEGLRIQ